jgi:hypothetical protein
MPIAAVVIASAARARMPGNFAISIPPVDKWYVGEWRPDFFCASLFPNHAEGNTIPATQFDCGSSRMAGDIIDNGGFT